MPSISYLSNDSSQISQVNSIRRDSEEGMLKCLFFRAFETCTPEVLRQLAGAYHDLLTHEKSLDFLIDRLQKDQLQDSIALNALDKTMTFYEVPSHIPTDTRFDFSFFF